MPRLGTRATPHRQPRPFTPLCRRGTAGGRPMHLALTLTEPAMGQLLGRLAEEPARALVCPAGSSRLPGCFEWLVGSADRPFPLREGAGPRVVVVGSDSVAGLTPALTAALS